MTPKVEILFVGENDVSSAVKAIKAAMGDLRPNTARLIALINHNVARRRHVFRQRSRYRNDDEVFVSWYHRLGA